MIPFVRAAIMLTWVVGEFLRREQPISAVRKAWRVANEALRFKEGDVIKTGKYFIHIHYKK